MNSLLKKFYELYRGKTKKEENPKPYEVVRIASAIPHTRMFILVATNKPKI